MDGWLKVIPSVLIVVIITVGCISQESAVTAAQIKINALQSVEDVRTYKFSVSGTMQYTTSNITGSFLTNGSSIQNGVIDIANNRFKVESTMVIPGRETDKGAIYFIDDVLYFMTETQGYLSWIKQNITLDSKSWTSYTQIMNATELLEMSDVARLDDEIINGVDCYVLKLEPELEKYYEIMMNQSGGSGSSVVQNFDISDMIEEWTVKCWVAKTSNLIMKMYMQIVLNFSFFGQSFKQSMENEIIFYDYNVDVTIEVPTEAEDASWGINIPL